MPIDDKIDLFREILLGIRALHMHKVYHRDLKPDNLRGEEKDNRVIAIDRITSYNVCYTKLLCHVCIRDYKRSEIEGSKFLENHVKKVLCRQEINLFGKLVASKYVLGIG